jgi:glycosyltransferase involved in cell wall biosynthesis
MNSRSPTVSVCIPTFNRAGMLREAIASVLAQTWPDFELIVCDNASGDDTEAVVKSFADERIAYYRNDCNIGQRPNWNRCLSLATGRYIALFFDDDMMMPDNLAEKVAVMEKHPEVGLVHSKFHIVDPRGKILVHNTNKQCAGEQFSDSVHLGREVLETLLRGYNIIHESTVMFRGDCYKRLGGFTDRLSLAFDAEYWMRIASIYDIAFIAKPLVKWREHSGSLTIETHRKIAQDSEAAITRLRSDLAGLRWVGEAYLAKLPGNHRAEVKRQLRRQMGERAAELAAALLEGGRPKQQVRSFLAATCRTYPEIFVEPGVWKVWLKTFISRGSALALKRLFPRKQGSKTE